MSERNLIYCLRRLEKKGELLISLGSGRGNLTTYRITLEGAEKVQASASFTSPEKVQDSTERVQQIASFSDQERVQDPVERVQDPVEKVQDPVEKGAKWTGAYKDIEPYRNHGNHKEPCGASAPAGAPDHPESQISIRGGRKPSARKSNPPKSQFHHHPSVVAYRDILGFYQLNAAQADLIAEATGIEVELAPSEWIRFLREVAQTGNKHTHNVRVMVAAFGHYKANVSLAKALSMAWDEAQGRQGGLFNATAPVSDQRTTEELGIRDCRIL